MLCFGKCEVKLRAEYSFFCSESFINMIAHKHIAGDTFDLAEIIVDYEKKETRIIDPTENKDILTKHFQIKDFIVLIFTIVVFDVSCGIIFLNNPDLFKLDFVPLLLIINFCTIYAFALWDYAKESFHAWWQYIANDFFITKSFIEVKGLKSRSYKLPREYGFRNIKLDWNLHEDYAKYIQKVHIKPLDFYIIDIFGKKHKQNGLWDAEFYFKEVPKKGKMELTFI